MRREHGTALLEIVVLGFATVLLVLPTLVTVARFVDANAVAASRARDAASWVARHGTMPQFPDPTVRVDTRVAGGVVRSTARTTVVIMSVGGIVVERDVAVSYEVPVSRYRSGR